MAVKTAREWAKEIKNITKPEMILCRTAHPAFFKAAHYFKVKLVVIDTTEEMKINVDDVKKNINKNTILLGKKIIYYQSCFSTSISTWNYRSS
jgi:sphinganine-1-phosphate aldolase